ncbi:hypothetical protein GCM10023184_06560 [Flaviaesturariibacter amylovorans]|uniref:RHS repeat-associated core domain-containing protein n=2 Tax=Flaviaesturariibacter amylovorans TaxID=1084520 RepID=A0ABP8GB99_9BACT
MVPVGTATLHDGFEYVRKTYELSNHLGNVLATVSDQKRGVDPGADGTSDYYIADVAAANDYYPFGMQMPGRKFATEGSYRYGFNGMEREIDFQSENYDFGARIYDSRIGRWLSLDKLQAKRPGENAYFYCGGNPIVFRDPDGNDRIITTVLTRQATDGTTITITRRVVVRGLETYRKVQQYDTDGKPTGNFEYYDTYETHFTTINSKGQKIFGSSHYSSGNTIQFVSDNDLDTKWGRFMEGLYDREPRKEGHRKGGGGIGFTSASGQGGGPTADFPDAYLENIDMLMGAFGQAGDVASFDLFAKTMTGIFTKKGLDKSELTQYAIAKVQDMFKRDSDAANGKRTDTALQVLPTGSDSCTVCGKIAPKGTINNSNIPLENYHGGKTKTRADHELRNQPK